MDVANYLIALKDGMSGPASAAEGALRKLESTIRREEFALSGMEAKLTSATQKLQLLQVGGGSERSIEKAREAVERLNEAIGKKKGDIASLKEAAPGYEKLASSAKQAADAQAAHTAKMNGFAEAAKGAKGSATEAGSGLDQLNDKMPQLDGNLGKVQQALAKLGPVGVAVAAVFAVVVTVATVLIGTLLKLSEAAIAVSQQKDGLTATFAALNGGAKGADAVHASVEKLDAILPQSKGAIEDWATSLLSAGIKGAELESGITAIASAAAMMPKTGAAASEKMIKQLAEGGDAASSLMKQIQDGSKKSAVLLADMGLQAADLAKALGVTPEKLKTMTVTAEQMGRALEKALIEKGKGALETMGLSWDSIKGKLHDGMESLFEDLGAFVQPFMREVKSLFSEFFEGATSTGIAKSLLTSFFKELFAIATQVTHAIHLGFLQVEIAMLRVYIFLAPLINAFRAMMGSTTFLDGLAVVLKVIGIALVLIGGPLFAITAAFWAFGTAVMAVIGVVISALTWCVGDAARAGSAIITGLGQGLSSGFSIIGEIMSNLGRTALNAFKSVLGIHSPSSVMRLQGQFTAQGAALGIEDGADAVAGASGDMAQGAADAGGQTRVTSGKGSSGNYYEVHNHFAPGTPDDLISRVEIAVRRVLENDSFAEPMPEGA